VTIWLFLGVIGLLGELYFFLMQRSALEVCRALDLPPELRFAFLPGYYRAGRVPTLLKWVAVVILVIRGSFFLGAGIILAAWVLSLVLPVPHAAFFEIFYRELDDTTKNLPDESRHALRTALEAVDRKYGVTDRFRSSA
jgi:hypothetical protein